MSRPTTHPSGNKEARERASVSFKAPAQTAGRFYHPELDVVRFLAFLLVFIHHVLPAGPDPRSFAALKTFGPLFYAVANAGRFGLSLGLIFLVAAISYRYFETPFLRMKKRHAVIQSQPISEAG